VHFRVAAFTNITHDHLDYHGDFASYQRAKRRLFDDLAPAVSVINVDDAFGAELARTVAGKVLRCSRKPGIEAEIHASSYRCEASGIEAEIATPQGPLALRSPLVGEHNLENLLIAIGCGLGLGFSLEAIGAALQRSLGAPGRLERVQSEGLPVFVDYAHTPDALERVLRALRPVCRGRLLVVFGCGGDRDRTKRPIMGDIAARLADLSIITSDNPRSEPPQQILDQIEAGARAAGAAALPPEALASAARGYTVNADRRAAIQLAVHAAQADDVVLIAGKGHEKYQIVGSRREPFDDCDEARTALTARQERS